MNSNDQFEIDAKVYIGNVPTDHLTDQELLQFFKPYGKISGLIINLI
jgi:RNA recognition motif-containing protein